MNPKVKPLVFWAPRILAVLMALFLMLFSLDVFNGSSSPGQMVLGFLIHNIPSMLLALVIYLAWKREWIGALVFPLLGLFYLFTNLGRQHWSAFAVITGPLVLIGLFFLLAWYKAGWRFEHSRD